MSKTATREAPCPVGHTDIITGTLDGSTQIDSPMHFLPPQGSSVTKIPHPALVQMQCNRSALPLMQVRRTCTVPAFPRPRARHPPLMRGALWGIWVRKFCGKFWSYEIHFPTVFFLNGGRELGYIMAPCHCIYRRWYIPSNHLPPTPIPRARLICYTPSQVPIPKSQSPTPMPSDPFASMLAEAARPGRKAQALPFAYTRELEVEDLAKASEAGGIKPIQLKEVRQVHHQIARLVAQGEKNMVIAEITGFSPSRISVLQSDPQFAEIVQHYKELEEEEHLRSRADFHSRLADLGYTSMEILHQRLLEEPDSITAPELLKILEASADRTGHGKTSTVNTTNATLVLTAQELADIRANTAPRQTDPAASPNREALLRLAVRATDPHSPDQAVSWIEGEGCLVREESSEGAEETGTG